MTYLVTGGTGFIGAYVVRDLLRSGEQVVSFDIAPNPGLVKEVVGEDSPDGLTITRGDVTDATQVFHTIQEHKVDRVVHLASLLTTSSRANFPVAMKVNCQGTNNVFEGATLFGVKKVVWASSVAVFGPRSKGAGDVVANDAMHDPRTVYGSCKSFNEGMALHYAGEYDLDVTGLRYTLVYGYGKTETIARGTGVTHLTELIDKPALGQGPCEVPLGDERADWLYVEDVARAVLMASRAQRPETKAFTVVGDLRPTREVFDYVQSLLPDTDMKLLPGNSRSIWNYDGSATLEEIGYAPEHKMEDGVRRNIDTLREKAGLPPIG